MWDDRFENLLRRYLPFLSADQPLERDVSLRDVGLDSLGTVELLAELENTYDVRFQDEALTKETFETPGVLWKTLSALAEPRP
ncbi:phosphopantetheine-binding protein [Streptomyces sp. DSM 3412]|uniref:Phosphopantetheine-binding protein n=1 Tax=Streptomyces gottesmaniae TaxID=3075518 RepID=A0ABU2ZF75_9ACTN|nr:phosphopantetheine-binding protein [Streptomyces sp. DSM 3412]MDT0574244.1 phosphopantetheine-binding protein [Streptomyces sp. DSM 3412]